MAILPLRSSPASSCSLHKDAVRRLEGSQPSRASCFAVQAGNDLGDGDKLSSWLSSAPERRTDSP